MWLRTDWMAAVSLALAVGGVAAGADDYRLMWADEFNEDGPPSAENWTYEHGFVRNEELQWYQPQNAVCRDGLLVIEARRETVDNPRHDPNSRDWRRRRPQAEYTSACLLTRGKHQWQYGRFEMRARIDTRAGLWPAFWTLGSARGWPACGEIDVMEYYDGKLLANACWAGRRRRPMWDATEHPLAEFGESWVEEFHVWRLEWTPEELRITVDDHLLNRVDLSETINQSRDRANPFREPHYLLVNLAVGGTNGGDPSQTDMPGRLEVDYIRVYQQAEEE